MWRAPAATSLKAETPRTALSRSPELGCGPGEQATLEDKSANDPVATHTLAQTDERKKEVVHLAAINGLARPFC